MIQRSKFSIGYYLMMFLLMLFLETMFFSGPAVKELPYSTFRDLIQKNKVKSVILESDRIYGLLKSEQAPPKAATQASTATPKTGTEPSPSPPKPGFTPQQKQTPWYLNFGKNLAQSEEARRREIQRQFTVVPLTDPTLLEDLQQHGVTYQGKIESHFFSHLISNWILPFGIFFLVWGWIMRKMGKGGGTGFLNLGKNKAKIYEVDPSLKVTFEDVAGVDEAVEEVKEVVSFLKEPGKYTRLGAKLPKGIMLVGPPGTGKTLLARAVAGEAGVPFFNLSGSDFVEMFVGVGAARLRDLFKEAKTKAPCIIFIDELDAVGKSRSQGPYLGSNDERENTLNQLLSEMDGFDPRIGIIIMGATNRPEVLDSALLRPGRFDRQILVDRPDLIGRVRIFEVHTRNLTLKDDVDLHKLAAEEIIFGEVSTGASNDLEKIAKIARNMITVYGMSQRAPNISLVDHQQDLFLGHGPNIRQHSEKLEQLIDDETQDIIRSCYADAKQILTDNRDKSEKMAQVLLEKEKMDEGEILAVLGPRVF
ncbi:MAG: ATP-dependent metallopeptidase FtsH/Yme1/Tma family protein [Desulfobacterales bacterium]|nr:MAG: ATP-dependent metallopeptidase FtsH/Yme1/Tma family protein [Desulfobacterales bacterium]